MLGVHCSCTWFLKGEGHIFLFLVGERKMRISFQRKRTNIVGSYACYTSPFFLFFFKKENSLLMMLISKVSSTDFLPQQDAPFSVKQSCLSLFIQWILIFPLYCTFLITDISKQTFMIYNLRYCVGGCVGYYFHQEICY